MAQVNYVLAFKYPKNMKNALNKPVPNELFELYDIILNRIQDTGGDSKEIAEKVLSWILRARRPLQMSELREAITISDSDSVLLNEDLPSVSDVVEACGSLIHHDDFSGTVAFSHEQVQRYLTERYISNLLTDVDIARACLSYFSLDVFEKGPSFGVKRFAQRLRDHPFGLYSARYWGRHTKGPGEEDPQVLRLLLNLMKSSEKMDSVTQLSWSETAADWSGKLGFTGRNWLHLLAENDLTLILTTILRHNGFEIPSAFPNLLAQEEAQRLLSFTKIRTVKELARRDQGGWSPLHMSAERGYDTMSRLLLAAGVDPSLPTSSGATAMHLAAANGHLTVVNALMKANADASAHHNSYGYSVLHLAVESGDEEVVRLLIEANVDVSQQDADGCTALHRAATKGHSKVVHMLLKSNANIAAKDKDCWTPICFAAYHGHHEVVDFLLKANAEVSVQDKNGWTPLQLAASQGHRKVVDRLIKAGADVCIKDGDGYSALHYTAKNGYRDIVELLIKQNADVSASDLEGWTALHCAARGGHEEVVELLIKNNANLSVRSNTGLTALHCASGGNHVKVADILIKNTAEVSAQSSDGSTALHFAASDGNRDLVDLLIKSNADLSIQDNQGWTALHCAASNGHLDVVKMLLKFEAEFLTRTKLGSTASHLAATAGHLEVTRILLEANDGMSTDGIGRSELHNAAYSGNTDLVKMLLNANFDVSMTDKYQDTALHVASSEGNLDVVKLLILAGANVDTENCYGEKAVHRAAYRGHEEVMCALLRISRPPPVNKVKFSTIVALLEVLVEINEDYRFYLALGNAFVKRKEYSKAMDSFHKCLKLDPSNAGAKDKAELFHVQHHCDGCDSRVQGYRHKCTVCSDFDLCAVCVQKKEILHPDHHLLQIPDINWVFN